MIDHKGKKLIVYYDIEMWTTNRDWVWILASYTYHELIFAEWQHVSHEFRFHTDEEKITQVSDINRVLPPSPIC